ncbi:2Fe-2S iron-sulfur cluster binding domain protein [Neorickettsia helminthoeca str. Oregon]|uniref:Adrenodoxin-like protein n=1 Tax=Neorickettsia helminthoeca str. Oregon TaxID=1286528 RepID=X5H3G2_9RICK|nr:ferredoxin family 2Fe-2S iron-sulfur cluster binding protein [Neorickettsia helminthoeca]AHX11238.1 2Fe-2S iron-sulfur cluster binding domain protein [Neorickettsia helminthoeca str. Oregon]
MSKNLNITFISPDGVEHHCFAQEGETILTVAHRNNIDLEGACEGSLACSTCHVIVDAEWFEKLEPISGEEDDMLDLAFGLASTSRLGCQITMNESIDGIKVRLPSATRNIK